MPHTALNTRTESVEPEILYSFLDPEVAHFILDGWAKVAGDDTGLRIAALLEPFYDPSFVRSESVRPAPTRELAYEEFPQLAAGIRGVYACTQGALEADMTPYIELRPALGNTIVDHLISDLNCNPVMSEFLMTSLRFNIKRLYWNPEQPKNTWFSGLLRRVLGAPKVPDAYAKAFDGLEISFHGRQVWYDHSLASVTPEVVWQSIWCCLLLVIATASTPNCDYDVRPLLARLRSPYVPLGIDTDRNLMYLKIE